MLFSGLKTIRNHLIVIFFIFENISIVFSQNPNINSHNLLIGKTDIEITNIFQAKNGFLWVGTPKGIFRYDGVESTHFTVSDGLAENNITAIAEDTSGKIWIGHASGLISTFHADKIYKFDPKEGTPAKKITSIVVDKQNRIWFATYGEGIYYYQNNRLFNLSSEDGLTDDFTYALTLDKAGNIWVGTDAGISWIFPEIADKKQKIKTYSMKNGLPDNIVKAFTKDKQGNIYIAMQDSGVGVFVNYQFKFLTNDTWSYGGITSLAIDAQNQLWIATHNVGLIKLQTKPQGVQKQIFTTPKLLSNKINAVFCDREDNIWIGTLHGLQHTNTNRFLFLSKNDGLLSDNVSTILQDRTGTYWVGGDSGITQLVPQANGQFQVRKITKTLPNLYILALFEDKLGAIWAGTYGGGLVRFSENRQKISVFTEKDGLANNNVVSIAQDKLGTIWVGTLGGGICKITETHPEKQPESPTFGFQTFNSQSGLSSDYVYCVYVDSKNNIWITTDGGGLCKFDGISKFQNWNEKNGLSTKTVFSIVEDGSGRYWLNTSGKGIAYFDNKTFKMISAAEGLRDEAPPAICLNPLNPNEVIVLTKIGIARYNSRQKNFTEYGAADGILNFEPNVNACYLDKTGKLWAGTTNGILIYNLQADTGKPQLPEVYITRMRVFLRNVPITNKLNYDQNHITFDFIGLNLSTPTKIRYRYKLDNFDSDWSLETQSRIVTYSNLPPGLYKILIQATTDGNVWSDPAVFSFEITPPFWKTWWFYIATTIIISVSAYSYVKNRFDRIEREKRILEQKVQERTKEITEQKAIIEEKNKDITESILYARRIQHSILPAMEEIYESFPESFVFYRPKDIVSGDFYWYGKTIDGQSVIAAVDCTGHGVPGAIMSVIGYNLLNEVIHELRYSEPAEILNSLDERVRKALRQDDKDSETKDGMDVALCVVDFQSRTLKFSGAFRPLYLLRNNEIIEFRGNRFPVGGSQMKDKMFTQNIIHLQPNDQIFIFSDGIVDQFGGEKGRKFTPKRLQQEIIQVQNQPIQSQQKYFESQFMDWLGTRTQLDDVLLIGIRFS